MSRRTMMAATTPFNQAEILEAVKGFEVSRNRKTGVVTTKNNRVVLKQWRSSNNYEMVNFKDAVAQLLACAGKIFQAEFYDLKIGASFQELKLKGKQVIINGDVFHEMLWLTTSSDGTRMLSVRFGLMRQVCSNGMCITLKGSGFSLKHLVSNNVNEEMKQFFKSLPKVDVTKQVNILKKIGNKEVTVRKVATALVNNGKKGNEKVWQLLVQKLQSSKTDRLGTKEDALITGINVPFKKMTKETLDAKLPAWTVLNCYTEIWRSLDASQIERETGKILEVLN